MQKKRVFGTKGLLLRMERASFSSPFVIIASKLEILCINERINERERKQFSRMCSWEIKKDKTHFDNSVFLRSFHQSPANEKITVYFCDFFKGNCCVGTSVFWIPCRAPPWARGRRGGRRSSGGWKRPSICWLWQRNTVFIDFTPPFLPHPPPCLTQVVEPAEETLKMIYIF